MNKTTFLSLASPFLWFGSSWAAPAQDVVQSDQITQDQQKHSGRQRHRIDHFMNSITSSRRIAILFAGVVINGTLYYSLPTQIIDPYGQITTLTYNTTGTFAGGLDKVTEHGGRYLQFFYTMRPAPYAQATLTRVEAHGLGDSTVTDSVNYTYALQSTGGTTVTQGWCLTTVTYSDGQQASYTYTTDNQPDNPTLPCPCPLKILPLVKTCKDVRYKGP